MTYHVAIENILLASDDHQIELDLFTYIMPFVSFITDAAVKRAYHLQAQNWIVCFKIISIFFYLSLYVLSLQRSSTDKIYWVASINFLVFPALMTLFWALLITKKITRETSPNQR